MLDEREVRQTRKLRQRTLLSAFLAAVSAVLLYFMLVGAIREPLSLRAASRLGETARELVPLVLILPAFAIFLVPVCLVARYVERFQTACPTCGKDITDRTERLLRTRRCPNCGAASLAGRPRSEAVYRRFRDRQSRRFLVRWFWAWPALGIGVMTLWRLDPSALKGCPQTLWIGPLIGTATAGWAFLRTGDRRCVPPLLASTALLGLGAWLFRNAL